MTQIGCRKPGSNMWYSFYFRSIAYISEYVCVKYTIYRSLTKDYINMYLIVCNKEIQLSIRKYSRNCSNVSSYFGVIKNRKYFNPYFDYLGYILRCVLCFFLTTSLKCINMLGTDRMSDQFMASFCLIRELAKQYISRNGLILKYVLLIL